jgi:PAS domain S-box-containing protein
MTKQLGDPLAFHTSGPAAANTSAFAAQPDVTRHAPASGSADDAVLDVDELGIIRACNPAVKTLLGYRPLELEGQHLAVLLPGLEETQTSRRGSVGQRLKFLGHCDISFRARRIDGQHVRCRVFVHNRVQSGQSSLRLILRKDDVQNDVCI